jgi:sigma-B regulation protein RsbU (phosphoserine phosphatase)
MARAWRQYTVLTLILVCAAFYEVGLLTDLTNRMRHGAEIPSGPFGMTAATRTIGVGPFRGDQILAIDGHPFTAERQLNEIVAHSHPGDTVHVVLSTPSGFAIEKDVKIPSEMDSDYPSAANTALSLCLYVLIPLVCLGLGFTVAFIRPRDTNAWILMFLLICFSGSISSPDWHRSFPDLSFFWEAFCNATWAMWILLFAVYFPERFALDRRAPWIKYLLIVPTVLFDVIFWAIIWTWNHNIDAALEWRRPLVYLYSLRLIFQMTCVAAFFAVLGFKSGMDKAPDSRRRLRILRIGASVALTPTFLIIVCALVRDTEIFAGIPWPLEVTALCMLSLFPITLAYVIIIERAMDLRFVLRQGVKYGLARGGLWLVRTFLIVFAVYVFSSHVGQRWRPWAVGFAVGGLAIIRRRNTEKASAWLDRKFFREAYDAETVLSELAVEAGRYVEIDPLLEKVAQRISDTLHVPDIVILVRDGNVYRTRYSTRLGEPMDIAASSHLLAAPGEHDAPLQVYFDKPQPWIRALNAEELQTLDYMRSELLLALRGRGNQGGPIIGIMSLGPKKSQEPYSKTDIRLLQAIAVQMGWALENSRLAASLADEAAHREVMNRELEIAREVQERLFPQKFPKIAGIDCWGYCRPARGVGGDYYDFIELPDGRLGIAIGDVSGTGIAAALLMASLQASLRGQTMAGVRDLAALMVNVNKLVYDASQSNRYATFFYAEFDPHTKLLSYVNAGHNAPVILRGADVLRLEACGPVVGLLPAVGYSMEPCQLQPGDIFVGYTDGISEAMNEQDEEWEEERFIAAARAVANDASKAMIEGIFRRADAFTGAAKQYDDMTLLAMKLTS